VQLKDLTKNANLISNLIQVVFFYTEYIYSMDVSDPLLQDQRKDPTLAPSAVADDQLTVDLLEVAGLIELQELGKDLTLSSATSPNSYKKVHTSGLFASVQALHSVLFGRECSAPQVRCL